MKFSIAIPAYENEKALERALNSIAKQSYKNIEIIVSDDCSKKSNLKKICEDFKKKNSELLLHYYYQERNLSPTLNLKFIFQKVKGDFILFLPHDDYLIYNDFLKECNQMLNFDKNITCFIANSFYEGNNKKMFENYPDNWVKIETKEKFLINFHNQHPAYSAVLVKRNTLLENNYIDLYFDKADCTKFCYEPDEIMSAAILSIYHGKTLITGAVVSVRGSFGDNYSKTDHWRTTYRLAVAMPLMKLYYYFKYKNRLLANHYLKLAVFRYCFVPLNIETLVYFKNIYIVIIMVFSRLYFKFRFIRGVNFILKKIINLDKILKK
jgi:glycosyltransferase involved in cell wall biosynthesis